MKYIHLIIITLLSISLTAQKKFDNVIECDAGSNKYTTIAKALMSKNIPLEMADRDLGYIKTAMIKNADNLMGSSEVAYVFDIHDDYYKAHILTKVRVSEFLVGNTNTEETTRIMGFSPKKKSHSYRAFDRLFDVIERAGGCTELVSYKEDI